MFYNYLTSSFYTYVKHERTTSSLLNIGPFVNLLAYNWLPYKKIYFSAALRM